MSYIPFRIVDLIMKFAGAYSQDPYKSVYLAVSYTHLTLPTKA